MITDWLQAIGSIGALVVSIFALRQTWKNRAKIKTLESTVTAKHIGGASGTFVDCKAGDNSFGAVSILQNRKK